ncbi:MAG: hypothetical protein CM1200mP34_3270 [Verrucomicrobiales bacterium]|nr:MAG: hypothetical protein CM1200mP34_3270 [Verrucomicrobiales bacterium]
MSIVGIERDSERIVNPGPGETLHEGDLLLCSGRVTNPQKGPKGPELITGQAH